MKDSFQQAIEQYIQVPVKPYLQPLSVPKSPRFLWWSGIRMQGVIPYGMSMVAYYDAPRQPLSVHAPLVAPVYYGSNRIFSGKSPVRGVYTGVKNGY